MAGSFDGGAIKSEKSIFSFLLSAGRHIGQGRPKGSASLDTDTSEEKPERTIAHCSSAYVTLLLATVLAPAP